MTNNSLPNEIRRILAAEAAASTPLSEEDVRLLNAYQQKHLDDLFAHEVQVYAEQTFRASLEIAKVAQDAGTDSPLAHSLDALSGGRPAAPGPLQDVAAGRCGTSTAVQVLPGGLCRPPVVYYPPYTAGNPNPEDAGPPATGPSSVFRTSSNLAVAETGILSVGAANGNLGGLGTYPSSADWLFGDANLAGASVLHIVPVFGGPYTVPVFVHLSVDVQAGQATQPFPYALIPGGPGSTGNGLVGLLGTMYLELYGANPLTEVPSRASRVFLRAWRSRSGTPEATTFPLSFPMSEYLALGPGAGWVAANIAVRVMAFRAGVGDPAGGFSGIDLRAPGEITHGLWFLQPAGGPIHISNLSITFCPLDFISADELVP